MAEKKKAAPKGKKKPWVPPWKKDDADSQANGGAKPKKPTKKAAAEHTHTAKGTKKTK